MVKDFYVLNMPLKYGSNNTTDFIDAHLATVGMQTLHLNDATLIKLFLLYRIYCIYYNDTREG